MTLTEHIPGPRVRLRCNMKLVSIKEVEVTKTDKRGPRQVFVFFKCPECGEEHGSLRFGF